VVRGFRNVQLIETDHDLDSLRSRDDFKRLVVELNRSYKQTGHASVSRLLSLVF
jgi:hypothetical protein